MPESEFVWTMPCFILSNNAKTDSTTGEIVLDSELQFVTPDIADADGNVEQQVAIFTDADSAQNYVVDCRPDLDLRLVEISSKQALMRFLAACRGRYRWVVIDPNPKSRGRRSLSVASILADRQPEIPDDPDDPDDQ